MTPNLIPVQITDKNGSVTTRWMRPDSDSGVSGATSLPVPALPVRQFVNHREEMEEILSPVAWEFNDDHTKFYATASEGVLAYMHEALTNDDEPDTTLPAQLSCLMNDNVEEHIIEAWLHLRDMHVGTMDDMGEVDYIRGAIESGSNPLTTYDRTNPEHAKTVRALYQFLHESDAERHGTRIDIEGITSNGIPASSHRITNPLLADYLSGHPDQIDGLIEVGYHHPEWLDASHFTSATELPDIFHEYLDTTVPLQQGVL